jgi:uncharacterized protein (DUF1015 family)
MAEIRPFKGLRYNTKKIKLEKIISEPYDRITPSMQEDYYQRNPYNVVRIILGKDDEPGYPEQDKYQRAKIYLDRWQQEGILLREDKEALYIYKQEFTVGVERKERIGLIGRVKLADFASKKVLPHERTFPKYKEDRLKLLKATNTNTEQILLLYEDDKKEVFHAVEAALKKAELGAEVKDEDNFIHRLWIIKEKSGINKIQKAMAHKVLIIADGHHRYETSLNYQKEMLRETNKAKGDEPFNYIMMTLFRLDDPGLVILPTYRLVKGLDKLSSEAIKNLFKRNFEVSELNWEKESDQALLNEVQRRVQSDNHTFAAFISELKKVFIFRLRSEDILDKEITGKKSSEWKRLDVSILHSLIIDKLQAFCSKTFIQEDNVTYIRNLDEGIKKVGNGEFQMIFLLKPVSLRQVRDVVENGELMPHKSTDFFPKLKSGLIMNPLDES